MDLLTTAEAATYLRLKERKLYELVANGAIPCTKVTGKWLFPRPELDHWLSASLVRPEGLGPADPMPIVGGSHDPLLEWALRESGAGLATLTEGSEAGLRRFARGELVAAAIHLHAIERAEVDANLEAMRGDAAFHDAVLVAFARREQGLLVAEGNPRKIGAIGDLVGGRHRVAVRQRGAGAQLLLEALLARIGAGVDEIGAVEPPCPTGPDAAQAVRAGRADCAIATRAVADAAGLSFVPLQWEVFDLVIRQRCYFRPPMQALVTCLRGPALAARAKELGGYDVADAGKVRYAP